MKRAMATLPVVTAMFMVYFSENVGISDLYIVFFVFHFFTLKNEIETKKKKDEEKESK
jgi:phosphotransferase system  glucose/maltose/N-acetylglucosamine-specific IIC component